MLMVVWFVGQIRQLCVAFSLLPAFLHLGDAPGHITQRISSPFPRREELSFNKTFLAISTSTA